MDNGGLFEGVSSKFAANQTLDATLEGSREKVNLTGDKIHELQENIKIFTSESPTYKRYLQYQMSQRSQYPQYMNEEQRKRFEQVSAYLPAKKKELTSLISEIIRSRKTLIDHLSENIAGICELQSHVLDVELIKWKRDQQLSGNGAGAGAASVCGSLETELDVIQKWCEILADLIWSTRLQVRTLAAINADQTAELQQHQPHFAEILNAMDVQVTSMLKTLLNRTFIVYIQPPQVLKTNTRFSASLYMLVGGQLNVYMTPPIVTADFITERQAQEQSWLKNQHTEPKIEASGKLDNKTATMEYTKPTGTQIQKLGVKFGHMHLRHIKRAAKPQMSNVTDEKMTILFQSTFYVGQESFKVWTLSLPVVAIVHVNQEAHAWATITWDNAFSLPKRIPFQVPDTVTWGEMAEVIRMKFLWATGGGDLTERHLRFLAEKYFRTTSLPPNTAELNNMPVSWKQFCKDNLHNRSFTFWEWFYTVYKMFQSKDSLNALWREGRIHGFIQRNEAPILLSTCQQGTFLVRFSDSELGGITISYVNESSQVSSIAPFSTQKLKMKSLPDALNDLGQQMRFLYPDIPKDVAFGKYYSKKKNTREGYDKEGVLKLVVESTGPGATPQLADPIPPSASFQRSDSSSCGSSPQSPVYMDVERNVLEPFDFIPATFNDPDDELLQDLLSSIDFDTSMLDLGENM